MYLYVNKLMGKQVNTYVRKYVSVLILYFAFCYEASESLILFLMIPEFRFDNKNAF